MSTHTANIQTDVITLEDDMTTTEVTERDAANAKANDTLLQFIKAVTLIRPTPKAHSIGPQLELIVLRGIHDMAAYFHDHLRDHYDARKDV